MYIQPTDLSSVPSPQLYFDYAYNYFYSIQYGELDDSLAVLLSTDCGATWNQIFFNYGAGLTTALTPGDSNEYTPATNEWKTQTIDLSAYASQKNVLIKFSARNNYGNDIYIDNINISSPLGITQNHGNISRVNVYPNPASDQFTMAINVNSSERTNIALYNVMGQLVSLKSYNLDAGENKLTVQADQLANGIYTILVSSASGSYQTKISVVK